jgi:hypothetical protein
VRTVAKKYTLVISGQYHRLCIAIGWNEARSCSTFFVVRDIERFVIKFLVTGGANKHDGGEK